MNSYIRLFYNEQIKMSSVCVYKCMYLILFQSNCNKAAEILLCLSEACMYSRNEGDGEDMDREKEREMKWKREMERERDVDGKKGRERERRSRERDEDRENSFMKGRFLQPS